jgi:hypothetical protein
MTSTPIVTRFPPVPQIKSARPPTGARRPRLAPPPLDQLVLPEAALPRFVRESALARHYRQLLGLLDWSRFPERDLQRNWGIPAVPYRPFLNACLIQLDLQLAYMSQLHRFLHQQPDLVWLCGFPQRSASPWPWSGAGAACLPTPRHFTRMLRRCPNAALQYLLDETVRLIQAELASEVADLGQCVSLDTKHILAWVQENNPKAYLQNSDRYDKTRQPTGDPDCRLGCKRRHNQRASAQEPPPTPTKNPQPAHISVGALLLGLRLRHCRNQGGGLGRVRPRRTDPAL